MKSIFALIGLAVAAIAVWWLFIRGKSADGANGGIFPNTDEKDDKMNGGSGGSVDPAYNASANCYYVPKEFPKFQPVAVPAEAKTILGVSDADWTNGFQDRLLGWFVAIDVTPAAYVLTYFGKDLVMQYLNSPVGQYPSNIVLKGSARCDSAKKDKMGGYLL